MAGRGMLTEEIKARSKELLGYEIDTRELRLMPHVLHVMMNEQKIDPNKINQEEREILSKWRKAKHIEGGVSGLRITKDFWNILCEIVMLGYVAIDLD